jgi:predicted small lipoprotein YifL
MRHFYLAMLSVAVLAACGDSGQPLAPPADARVSAAVTTITNERVPFSQTNFVPCANGGAGELVQLEGSVHEVTRTTETGSGAFSFTLHINPQGVTGTGLTTGDTYQGTGAFTLRGHLQQGEVFTVTDVFNVIGPGPDNNFRAHTTFHFTVNANGVVTSEVENVSVECS